MKCNKDLAIKQSIKKKDLYPLRFSCYYTDYLFGTLSARIWLSHSHLASFTVNVLTFSVYSIKNCFICFIFLVEFGFKNNFIVVVSSVFSFLTL